MMPSIHLVQLSDKDRAESDWAPQVEDLQVNKIYFLIHTYDAIKCQSQVSKLTDYSAPYIQAFVGVTFWRTNTIFIF